MRERESRGTREREREMKGEWHMVAALACGDDSSSTALGERRCENQYDGGEMITPGG